MELDPFNVHFQSFRAQIFVALRRYDEAITQARDVLRSVPGQPVASTALLAALHHKGMDNEVMAEWKGWENLRGNRGDIEAFERGYKEGGYGAGWKRLAEYQAARFSLKYTNPFGIAVAFARAGEDALALDWLDKAFEIHDPNMPYAFVWPYWETLRSNPRFQALRRKMNLPE